MQLKAYKAAVVAVAAAGGSEHEQAAPCQHHHTNIPATQTQKISRPFIVLFVVGVTAVVAAVVAAALLLFDEGPFCCCWRAAVVFVGRWGCCCCSCCRCCCCCWCCCCSGCCWWWWWCRCYRPRRRHAKITTHTFLAHETHHPRFQVNQPQGTPATKFKLHTDQVVPNNIIHNHEHGTYRLNSTHHISCRI